MLRNVITMLLIPMVLASQGWRCLSHAHCAQAGSPKDHDLRRHIHVGDVNHAHADHHGHGHAHGSPAQANGHDEGPATLASRPREHDADAIYCLDAAVFTLAPYVLVSHDNAAGVFFGGQAAIDELGRKVSRAMTVLAHPPAARFGRCARYLQLLSIRC